MASERQPRAGGPAPSSRATPLLLHGASVLALVGLCAVAGGLGWATHLVVRGQEGRLLKERANEVALVFTSAITTTSSSLSVLGGVVQASNGSSSEFDRAAAAEVGAGTNELTFALMRATPAGFEVIAAQGQGLTVGEVVSDERAATLRQAMTATAMVATPVVGPTRLLGFALGPPAAPPGMVLYRQTTLGRVSAPRQAGTAPFNELDVALYASPRVDQRQVLVTTASTLPLRGSVRYQTVQVGSTTWLLAASARTSLVGSTAEAAPWGVLAAVLVLAVLLALVIEVEGRRRDAAMRLYDSEHHVAETLQRSLLPEVPSLPGLGLAARYLAGAPGQEVGGDWFDVFPIEGGRVGLVIGDVMGHDLVAAAAMSQIRAALRAYAWRGDTPAIVLDKLDQFVTTFALTPLVTVFYGVLEAPTRDGGRLLRYANAGHLAPLVQTPDHRVRPLVGPGSVIIGGLVDGKRSQAEEHLDVGSMLVLFTDGLVETPLSPLDVSLDQLAARIADEPAQLSADGLCDFILSAARAGELEDDVALLVVRILAGQAPESPPPSSLRANGSPTTEPVRPVDATSEDVAPGK